VILLKLNLTKLKLEDIGSVFSVKKKDINTDNLLLHSISTSAQVCFYYKALNSYPEEARDQVLLVRFFLIFKLRWYLLVSYPNHLSSVLKDLAKYCLVLLDRCAPENISLLVSVHVLLR